MPTDFAAHLRTVLGRYGATLIVGADVKSTVYSADTAALERDKVQPGTGTNCGQGPYLRTGDLGAVVGGDLVVTGRLKDVLIVHGRNLHTQDVEHAVHDIRPALGAGSGVVFGVSDLRDPRSRWC